MVAPNPLAARRRTNSSSFSVAVPSSWEESVVSGAIANRFAISRPLLNLKGDQTAIDQSSNILKLAWRRMDTRSLRAARSRLGEAVVLVEDASRVDDDSLAGHGLGAAHGDHHVGAVVLVGWPLQERARGGAADLLGPG